MMFTFIFFILLRYYILIGNNEVKSSAIEIIKHWGYENSTRKKSEKKKNKPVVFLQHGLLGSSADWLINLPNQSAGFIFADSGFDVFLGNVRGNTYSTEHASLNVNLKEYWNFSLDEMVKYDLDAMINKVLEISGQDYLYYIGYSQGTLIMFSKLSLNTNLTKKIRQFHALAPVGTVGHIKGPLYYISKFFNNKEFLIELIFGQKNFLSNNWSSSIFKNLFCKNPITNNFCNNIYFTFTGKNSKQLNNSNINNIFKIFPADTSIKNMIHWSQMINSGSQQMYNYEYGQLNTKYYGQTTPPIYNISNINVNTYLYWGNNDYLVNPQDIINNLINKIKPNFLKANFMYKDFNHLDFVWGLRASSEVYKTIIINIKNDLKNISF
uniref:Lipase n=2 Tax=Strongyloides stercoralis TaxID=6248 RepID=A0A0K0ERU8_STRER